MENPQLLLTNEIDIDHVVEDLNQKQKNKLTFKGIFYNEVEKKNEELIFDIFDIFQDEVEKKPFIKNETGQKFYLYNLKQVDKCTGFKDKQGELLFESDYVTDQDKNVYKIIWFKDCFGLKKIKGTGRYPAFSSVSYMQLLLNYKEK